MLSVQSPGCAGMERLGVPTRNVIGSPPDDRSSISRRMRVEAIQARDILVRDANIISDRQVRNNHNHHFHSNYHYQHHLHPNHTIVNSDKIKAENRCCRGCRTDDQNVIRCPHHVPLPDSEWGQDKDLQIRTRYQQAEITRSYIKPPPNKTVLDVPEQSYNLFPSSSFSSSQGLMSKHHHQHQEKSKPNVITKFLLRISNPKSTAAATGVSSSTGTTTSLLSSSIISSSNSSTLSLPVGTVSALTTTNCNLGSNLGILSTSLTSSANSVSSMPTAALNSSNNSFHQNQYEGNISNSMPSISAISSTELTLALTTQSSILSQPSSDCCYKQATSVRPRSPITDIGNNNNNHQLIQRDYV